MRDFIGKLGTGMNMRWAMHGLRRMNKNGELLGDFCAFNNMVVGGSIFPHKDTPTRPPGGP